MTIVYKTKILTTKTEIQADSEACALTRLINTKIYTVMLPADVSVLKLKNLISMDDELFMIMSN